ncbi:MAG: hypothetical protein NC397_05600 [Clostridium sp.]|nr:hypothetical protein [Clostridium sp.]
MKIKQFFKAIFCLCLICIMLVPTTAFANEEEPDWVDANFTDEQMEEILNQGNGNDNTVQRASGLINLYAIGISKSGTTINIIGKTIGNTEVVKSGFTKVVIQRRANSSSSWSNYKTYKDIYADLPACYLSKSITVAKGYQYRATCVHYAKKSLLSTQKLDNTSNTVTIS